MAPALKKGTEAVHVVAAFVYAYTLAVVVVKQYPARPFIIAAQVREARILPSGRRLCMDDGSDPGMSIYATNVVERASNNF